MARVLVVDDDDGVREFVAEALARDGHVVTRAADGAEASRLADRTSFDLVITDLRMPNVDGMTLLGKLRAEQPDVEVILLTAHGTVDTAVAAMKAGAFEYLEKPLSGPQELRLVCARALERRSLVARALVVREPDEVELTWGAPAMVPVVEALRRVAPTQVSVLLLGESGTGKDVAARAIHRWSGRASGPFVAVNCAALAETLLETELFGHEKGAFTGALAQRRGRIELAQGGTLLLDEIAELRPELQAKLLRVLQERTFERIGGTRSIDADARWIAATHRDVGALIAGGRFREDLYHRLAVFPIRLPRLRDRREDIAPLAERLLRAVGADLGRPNLALSGAAVAVLEAAPWRGNIRELRNVLERAAIVVDGEVVDARDLWLDPAAGGAGASAPAGRLPTTQLDRLEDLAIAQVMDEVGGNRKLAAERLGIGLRTLYEKLRKRDDAGKEPKDPRP